MFTQKALSTGILNRRQLDLYQGLSLKLPGLSVAQNAWLNLILMCAGIGSPGTLAEVFRGYLGDTRSAGQRSYRQAPQFIEDDEVVSDECPHRQIELPSTLVDLTLNPFHSCYYN